MNREVPMKSLKPFPFQRSISYAQNTSIKTRWHANARVKLHVLASMLGLNPDTFDIRSNYGGIAVSGETTLHGENIYIQVSQPCMGTDNGVLYRRCNGRKDYTGQCNRFASLQALNAPSALASVIKRDLGTL